MATINNFEELEIWIKARKLNKRVLEISQRESIKKDFRFYSQIRVSAGSIMDNIAEGFERDSRLEFINHLSYSKGSCGEIQSQLFRAFDDNTITEDEHNELILEYKTLARDIGNFIRYLNKSDIKGQKFLDRK
jgi:four helix bundle protein